jgi:uncharacterized cupredoxin-like copper-binding protein
MKLGKKLGFFSEKQLGDYLMNTKQRFFFIIALTTIALLLSACGGSSESSEATGPKEITVGVKDEFNFDPNTFTAKAGEEVNVTFNNTGTIPHSFVILNSGVMAEDMAGMSEEEEHELLVMEMHDAEPGETGSETFTAPSEPGEYTFICAVPGHAEAGMTGTLTVTN